MRPNCYAHVVLPLVAATSGVHYAQVAVHGHQGAGGTGGPCGHHGWVSQSTRCRGDPMGPKGFTHVRCYLCWLLPVGHTRAKWQCVATRGAVGRAALLALVATVGG